ncbi:MAG: hypothetical protein TREMPRED_004789 [Tremellales sp. Tagirdzhanova-0007]|nr:MAG: hypothetical protein TREMPRED_004789 [Tremellales sp. Tagirdzhanova-0007]
MFGSGSTTTSRLCLVIAGLTLALSVSAGTPPSDCPSDPYADPANDTCNPVRYIPNKAVNIVAAVLYFIVAIVLTWQNYRHRANYMLCLVIGAYCEGLGIVFRLIFRTNPHSTGIYILEYLFVVLSPCAFLAGDYILLGRLVLYLDAPQYLRPLKPKAISWTFVISDVITFLIQAAGGGLSISTNPTTAKIGGRVFLAGIAAQMASFLLFSSLWAMFAFRAYIGYLATHERYFLGLDTLPLWLGITTFTYFWPGKYITPRSRVDLPNAQNDASMVTITPSHGEGAEGSAAPVDKNIGSV